MRGYRFTPSARADLEGIREYLAPAPHAIQIKIIRNLEKAFRQAVEFSLTGRLEPDFITPASGPIRSILTYPYRIFYRVETEPLIIVGILHGAQDIPTILRDRGAI